MKHPLAQSEKQLPQAPAESAYERDYYAWVQDQVRALRERRPEALDWENLCEEVGDLAASLKRELRSRLEAILTHLLKWRYQPRKRSVSWRVTLVEQRHKADGLLEENSSLRSMLGDIMARAYGSACSLAGTEMGLEKKEWQRTFPAECPWSAEQVLDEDFLPNPPRAASRSR